ncbi:MAG: DNA-3-methyladenine glycosylase I [Clostridiales bacterium]|jgi:DNA-3-methyladenine glycosylase I|nr:DNA-3-methyladenine glycosylase I [Clostridiales bacterium]
MPKRCQWGDTDDLLMRDYHDNEWGKPCFDERKLFEMLILECAQAGLSWRTILHKREAYKLAFDNFDAEKVAGYSEDKIAELMQNRNIIRNRLKIVSAVTNAQLVLKLGSLSNFIWSYVNNTPIVNAWENHNQIPATSSLSDQINKDMKKIGFKFIGSTIIYSYLQSIGAVNDHMVWCEFRGQV